MKSIIFFTIFSVIAYISSKSKSTLPANTCVIILIDDDSKSDQDNIVEKSLAIPDMAYDLQDDIKEMYVYSYLDKATYPGYKCQYEIKACRSNNYSDCATFTGSVSVDLKSRGFKARHPTFSDYISSMNSIKGSTWAVAPPAPKPEPVPIIEKPAPKPVPVAPGKPEQLPPAIAPEWNLENIMERAPSTRRKMRKSRKARKN